MKMTVIVPTYRRPSDLYRCLEALKTQERPADQVLVTVREDDSETNAFLRAYDAAPLPIQIVQLTTPGVVAAMNAGLAQALGYIIALTDDDTAPYPDWLRRIETHFATDPQVGGVGGRDRVHQSYGVEEGAKPVVGRLEWFGCVIGNHHIGCGEAREVDVLKGVNSAYRIAALRAMGFDTRLKGGGAQVHWELSLGLSLKRAGWKLIYDPSIIVEHYPAQRFDEDQRNTFDEIAQRNAVYNETLILLEHFSLPRRVVAIFWFLVVGTRIAPGLFQFMCLLISHNQNAFARFKATVAGRLSGIVDYKHGQRLLPAIVADLETRRI